MADMKTTALTQRALVDNTENLPALLDDATTDARLKPRTIAAAGNPSAAPGVLHWPVAHGPGASTQAIVAGSYYLNVFRARPGLVLDRLHVEVTTAPGADGTARVGCYDHDFDARRPVSAAPLYDSGDVAYTAAAWAASTTPKELTLPAGGIVVPLSGLFWVALQFSGSMTLRRGVGVALTNLIAQATGAAALSTTTVPAGFSKTGAYGAMPTGIDAGLAATFAIPICVLSKA